MSLYSPKAKDKVFFSKSHSLRGTLLIRNEIIFFLHSQVNVLKINLQSGGFFFLPLKLQGKLVIIKILCVPFIIYRLLMNRQDHRFVQNCSHLEVRSHQSVGNSHSWEFKKRRRSLKQDLKGSIALSFLSFFLFLIFHHSQSDRQITL